MRAGNCKERRKNKVKMNEVKSFTYRTLNNRFLFTISR
jgi:hypothetical protein